MAKVTRSTSIGEFMGTTRTDGTDREQRGSTRSVFESYIRESPVQAATKIWRDINNCWAAHRPSRRCARGRRDYALVVKT